MDEPAPRVREALKSLPSIDDLLTLFPSERYRIPRRQVKAAMRATLADMRQQLLAGKELPNIPATVETAVGHRLEALARPNLRPVLNGTGVVLHTGLGRAPLSRHVLDQAFRAVSGYANLELDLHTGKRGERLDLVADLILALTLPSPTGSAGALVVNNNAAAVLLMLNAIAEGQEVVVSRGQQVEIGGSFRIPDVIKKAQAVMVEVGTTNRTHLSDYEQAITRQTGALLYVHPSNYKVVGFTKEVSVAELADLAKRKGLPLLVDLGSGSFLDAPAGGLAREPSVASILKEGADVVCFSGDKLLGGPQSGILVGRSKWLKRLRSNPLYRALRCDKVTLAILEQTLRTYLDEKTYFPENLTLRLLERGRVELRQQADDLLGRLSPACRAAASFKLVESTVEAGSGSLPQVDLPSMALAITWPGTSPSELARRFRLADPPVVGYVHKGQYFIDLKAIPPEQNDLLIQCMEAVLVSTAGDAAKGAKE